MAQQGEDYPPPLGMTHSNSEPAARNTARRSTAKSVQFFDIAETTRSSRASCQFGNIFTVDSTMTESEAVGDGQEERALNNNQVMERYRHFRAIRQGYAGLGLFLLMMLGYVLVLKGQHQTAAGDANDVWQNVFEKLKPDLKISDTATMYKFMSAKAIPRILAGTWASTTRSGKQIHGRTSNEYSHVIGGLMVTAIKTRSHRCFRGNTCYSTEKLDDPFYTISIPKKAATLPKASPKKSGGKGGKSGKASAGDWDDPDLLLGAAMSLSGKLEGSQGHSEGNATLTANETHAASFSVPYNPEFGGYSICLPSSASVNESKQLLAAFAGLFGPDTRELWLHLVLLDPSGIKTMTSLAFGAKSSIQNNFQMETKMTTIPYHLYPIDTYGYIARLVLEVSVTIFAFWAFVIPLLKYLFFEPKLGEKFLGEDLELSMKWFAWIQAWAQLPVRGGRLRWEIMALLYTAFFGAVFFWIGLCIVYSRMGRLDEQNLDFLFVDPLSEAGDDLPAKMGASMAAMHTAIMPCLSLVEKISTIYNWYFMWHVVVMTLMVWRLQQYFAFQKRLAIVTDTFNVIIDDLLHTGIVTLLSCFFFGVIDSLAYGAYDPGFQKAGFHSFFETLMTNFALYRPSASNIQTEQMFKYSPHLSPSGFLVSIAPVLIQVLYKTTVFLLLWKILMGVIMEGYKKHAAKLKEHARTVRQDLSELSIALYHYVWEHLLLGRPFVSFFHVALAISQLKPSKERPWDQHFLGLDHSQAVQDALNAVFQDTSQRMQMQVQNEGLKPCGKEEVGFVLDAYGMNRERAQVLFSELWVDKKMRDAQKKDKKRKESEKDNSKQEKITDLVEASTNEAMQKLSMSRAQKILQSTGGWKRDATMGNPEKGLSAEYLDEVFKEYDVLNIGTVDHRLMPQLFRMMGFRIDTSTLADLLNEYDHNEDGDTSLAEFKEIICDNRLIGYWVASRQKKSVGLLSFSTVSSVSRLSAAAETISRQHSM